MTATATAATAAATALHAAIDAAGGRECAGDSPLPGVWAELARAASLSPALNRDGWLLAEAEARAIMTQIVEAIGDFDSEMGDYSKAIWAVALEAGDSGGRTFPELSLEVLAAAQAALTAGFACTQQ